MKTKALLILALLASAMAFGQQGEILYTDFDPDSTQTFHNDYTPDPPLYLDVNHDGVAEWLFESREGYHATIELFFHDNQPTYNHAAFSLQLGDTLSLLPECQPENPCWVRPVVPQYWIPPENTIPGLGYYPPHFIGIRRKVEEGYCYGWIELSVNIWDDAKTIDLTVYRMAFCTEPNYPLRVGQTSFNWTASQEETVWPLQIHPNPASSSVTVGGEDIRHVEIHNLLGQKVATFDGNGNESLTIDISSLSKGVYLVTVRNKEGRSTTRKLAID